MPYWSNYLKMVVRHLQRPCPKNCCGRDMLTLEVITVFYLELFTHGGDSTMLLSCIN
uniref:Uncharacterized protein n=1 Tax=Arundo donax TaxID=35708 RepID=A0A0A8Y1U3_ARUDO